MPVFIDEYSTSGALLQSIQLPTQSVGGQLPLILDGFTGNGGQLSRSVDGRYLVLAGYGAPLPIATPFNTESPRVIGRIDAAGVVEISPGITGLEVHNEIRGAVSTDGTDVWVTTRDGGVHYVAFGSTTATTLPQTTINDVRHLLIADGQLYYSRLSTTASRIYALGNGLPTTPGQSSTSFPGVVGTNIAEPLAFVLHDLDPAVPGVDSLYVINRGDDTVRKFAKSGDTWLPRGSIGAAPGERLRGLASQIVDGHVQLFITSTNRLLTFTDTAGRDVDIGTAAATQLAVGAPNTAFRGLAFAPINVNEPPTITLGTDTVVYHENDPPAIVDPFVAIADADSADFAGGTLTVALASGATAEDHLAIRHQGSAPGQIGVVGANILYEGSVIGTYSGGVGGVPLEVSLLAGATPEAVQALARSVTFESVSDDPPTGPRVLQWVVTDGDGGTSAVAETTLSIVGVNDGVNVLFATQEVTYSAGDADTRLDATAELVAVDSTLLTTGQQNARLVIALEEAEPGDLLSIVSDETVIVVDDTVFVGGNAVATLAGGAGEPLEITFQPSATVAAAQAILRRVAYRHTSPHPDSSTRQVSATFIEADGTAGASAMLSLVVVGPPLPRATISGGTVVEGNEGTQLLVFTVTLSDAPFETVTIAFATEDDTATAADGDYLPQSGQLVFEVGGALSQQFSIPIAGDPKFETDEQLRVRLTEASGAELENDSALGTIFNDDERPQLSINDVTVAEGSGGTTQFVFTVSLSNPTSEPVSVDFATVADTALAGDDFVSINGTVVFPPDTSILAQTISVPVIGDTVYEPAEQFIVQLTNPTNATLADDEGTGQIIDDDPFDVVVTAAPADGLPDTIRVYLQEGSLIVTINGLPHASFPYGGVRSLAIHGSNDDDTLLLDPIDGPIVVAEGITFLGGPGHDRLLVPGTAGPDTIDVQQLSPGELLWTVNGVAQSLVIDRVERIDVESGAGDDLVRVELAEPPPSEFDPPLTIHIDGGNQSGGGDRLLLIDGASADAALLRLDASPGSGSLTLAPATPHPLLHTYANIEQLVVLDAAGTPLATIPGRLTVLRPDLAEPNDDWPLATPFIVGQLLEGVIDPPGIPAQQNPLGNFDIPGDRDLFRIVAPETGMLDIRLFAELVHGTGTRPGLPGNGDLSLILLGSAGEVLVDGQSQFGMNDDNNHERIRIPAVAGETYFVRVEGATPETVATYQIQITSVPAPVPYDLAVVGAGQAVNSPTPIIRMQVDESVLFDEVLGGGFDEMIIIPPADSESEPGFRVALFIAGTNEPIGFARRLDEGVYEFDFQIDTLVPEFSLPDGLVQLVARVEMIDPAFVAAWSQPSSPLELLVDTLAPALDAQLQAESDTGTRGDRVTSDTTPTFAGTTEPGALVRLFVDRDLNGTLDPDDPLLGEVVSASGVWQITSMLDLNDGSLFPVRDGLRHIVAVASDAAGNVSVPVTVPLFLDTQAPRIVSVQIDSAPNYHLFHPTPQQDGRTPLVERLRIRVRDFPSRDAAFLTPALLPGEFAGQIELRGDFHGLIAPSQVSLLVSSANPGAPSEAEILLEFAAPLPDDRYTLTMRDSLTDVAGNALDGETDAAAPQADPHFPSGNGVAGGTFVARFTVDSRPEIGSWGGGSVWVDHNGNGYFDPQSSDAAHRDIVYALGLAGDALFAGNFALLPTDVADGFDKLAAYGVVAGQHRFLFDVDHDGVPDNDSLPSSDPVTLLNIAGIPVSGRFDDNDANGDEVGVFDGERWYFDTNHNYQLDDEDRQLSSDLRGWPIVGDFDGDGFDDLATWHEGEFAFDFARGERRGWDGIVDATARFDFAAAGERPVAADMDGDGIDDLGLWHPAGSIPAPVDSAEWYFIVSHGKPLARPDVTPATPGDRVEVDPIDGQPAFFFTPAPFAHDLHFSFGDPAAQPIVGNFDPPVVPASGGLGSYANPQMALDVDGDGIVSPLDALLVVNELNARGSRILTSTMRTTSGPFFDTSDDRQITPLDALLIINHLNGVTGSGEGETEATAPATIAEPENDAHFAWMAWNALLAGSTAEQEEDELLDLLAGDLAAAQCT